MKIVLKSDTLITAVLVNAWQLVTRPDDSPKLLIWQTDGKHWSIRFQCDDATEFANAFHPTAETIWITFCGIRLDVVCYDQNGEQLTAETFSGARLLDSDRK